MNDIVLNIKALAAMKNMSIEELAKACEIDYNHLKQVSAGRVKMTAYDLKKLSEITGVPADNIEVG
ncbi:helix-turn-helix domain-containing protein [Anaerolactibacter massiliensis]|uniref:helix-turn-helix domain-containing protein n=1 Tax=Anaerolactibacter massiliensis TaxID=2044573 RepID=UPI000CFA4D01|nr:helix-turn-helix transcriptional regulator [Anaerolactibacter massiliensis]